MRILGIDYGRRKIGLAIGENSFSEPLRVVRVNSFEDAIQKIKSVFSEISADKIVVGISEGKMGEESKRFAKELDADVSDETLTSQEAQRLSMEAGIHRKKRRGMEDAYAAAIMLQSYLDTH